MPRARAAPPPRGDALPRPRHRPTRHALHLYVDGRRRRGAERGTRHSADIEDEAKAFEWFEKSHEAGNVCGSGHLGRCYLLGYGVPTCQALDQVWQSRGATLLSEAAGRGSKRACFNLGFAYAEGHYGFPKDEKMARRYYSMVASDSIENCSVAAKEIAATWLREHPAACLCIGTIECFVRCGSLWLSYLGSCLHGSALCHPGSE